MNKVINIILLSFIAIVLTVIMVVLLLNDNNYFSFSSYNEKIVFNEEYDATNITNLDVESISADIIIKQSENDKISVIVYGNKANEVSAKLDGNTLEVKNTSKTNFCIGFCFGNKKIEISVPIKEYDKYKIYSISGDIDIFDIELKNIEAKSTSGDIKLFNANSSNLNTKSGDINFNNISNAEIKNISGNIEGIKVGDITASTISGEVDIQEIANYCKIKTTSGDIDISSLVININSSLQTISGDVKVLKTNDVYISTSTISGNVSIDNNNRYATHELSISTISGDIKTK